MRTGASKTCALLLASVVVAACSASAPQEATRAEGEAVAATCAPDPGCYYSPTTWESVAPYDSYVGAPPDTAFIARLQALGCTTPAWYAPGGPLGGFAWPIAFCPNVTLPLPASPIPCDACTGAPPSSDWTVATWKPSNNSPGSCHSVICADLAAGGTALCATCGDQCNTTIPDGCGDNLTCGDDCGPGLTCGEENTCGAACVPTSRCAPHSCGWVDNGCGQDHCCGSPEQCCQ